MREEIEHIREGKHGARSAKQAIAIGLSKARRAGVKLAGPKKGKASAETRKQAARDLRKGESPGKKKSAKRSRAMLKKLKVELCHVRLAAPRLNARRHRVHGLRRRPQGLGRNELLVDIKRLSLQ